MSSNGRFTSLPSCFLAHYDVFVEDTDLSKNFLYVLQHTCHKNCRAKIKSNQSNQCVPETQFFHVDLQKQNYLGFEN